MGNPAVARRKEAKSYSLLDDFEEKILRETCLLS